MEKKWWHDAVMYEIYCRSFCDTNGDGIGDLRGVISKLPVLKELGINCIWFSPIYKSPMVDNGYDVADYQDIDPSYGTLADFRELVDDAHSMGIRIVMDMVLNHSSDEHRWFQEAKKSGENPYHNYYIWQPPGKDGSEPNNWGNYFREGNGSAWQYNEATGEYYLHQYSKKMPDLNWEYPPLREEIYRMIRWWIDFGIDGFRFDVFTRLKKPAGFPDTPKEPVEGLDRNGFVVDQSMCTCVEGIHEIWKELHARCFEGTDIFTMGEGSGINSENAADYVSQHAKEVDCAYMFSIASRKKPPFTNDLYRREQTAWYEKITKRNGFTVQFFSNHDQPRIVSHYGNDTDLRRECAKAFATLKLTAPGMPILFQGDEIGMANIYYPSIEDYNDAYTIGDYRSLVASGKTPEEALRWCNPRSRDHARAPYCWTAGENAGFTDGRPWLKISSRYREINYETDRQDPGSVFEHYKKLIGLRSTEPAIVHGDLRFYLEDDAQVLLYTRSCALQTLLIIVNKSNEEAEARLPEELKAFLWRRILTSRAGTKPSLEGRRRWLPWEAEIYELDR